MTEHPSTQVLKQYQGRTLSPDVFLAVHRHVSSCPVCSEQSSLATQKDYDNLFSALLPSANEESYHLSSAELSAYVQDGLAEIDRENAESHLEVCDQCREKTEAARINLIEPTSSMTGWWQTAVSQSGRIFQSRPVQIAALILVTLTLMVFGFWLWRRERAPLQTPVHDVNDQAPKESQAAASPEGSGNATGPSTEVALQLNDGGRSIVLNTQGNLQGLDHLPATLQESIRTTLIRQELEKPVDAEILAGETSVLLGEPVEGVPFQLVTPVGKVVSDDRPIFRWRPLAGATSYVVTVMDSNLDEIATSVELSDLEWRSPKKLRGGIYSWQVTAIKEGRRIISPTLPAPQAKFKVLDANRLAELARARRNYPDYHLALGVLFNKAGLVDEAEREFELLLKANPRSAVAKKLLDQVRENRR